MDEKLKYTLLRSDLVDNQSIWTRHEKRVWFITLLTGTCMLYSTRTTMPLLVPSVASEQKWSKTDSGTVLSSFFWGYTLTQVVGGYFSDKFGGQRVILFAALGWSLITAFMPNIIYAAPSFKSYSIPFVVTIRIMNGAFQGVHFPSMISLTSQDSKWSHAALCYPQMRQQFPGVKSMVGQKTSPKNHVTHEDVFTPVRKDTRQELLDKTREEIRQKILDQISKTFQEKPKYNKTPPEGMAWIKRHKTIGVSTDSTPRLLPEQPVEATEEPKENTVVKLPPIPREYIVMKVDTTNVHSPSLSDMVEQKKIGPSIGMKLFEIMGTLMESVLENPPSDSQHINKFLRDKIATLPTTKVKEIISSIYGDGEPITQTSSQKNLDMPAHSSKYAFIPNCYAAFYNPPPVAQVPQTPNPQFKLINLCNSELCTDLTRPEIVDTETLNIPRRPVICPISSCQRTFFVSSFTKHIAGDHTQVPIERIMPEQCKDFFLDPKLIHFGISSCQVLLLVKDRIKNFGNDNFKNFIPVLVMTTKVSLLELCSSNYRPENDDVKKSTQNFFMIWLTGITEPQLPISYNLVVWARSGYRPACHRVYSGRLYSIRNSQTPEAVRMSGQMMLLSEAQVNLLTNNGRHMLAFQNLCSTERTSFFGLLTSGSAMGTLLTGILGSFVLDYFGWSSVFRVIGFLGISWALLLRYYAMAGDRNRIINVSVPSRLCTKSSDSVPWLRYFGRLSFWACVLTHACEMNCFFVLLSWLPTYFHDTFPLAKGWVVNMIPWLALPPCTFFAKYLTTCLIAREWNTSRVRKIIQSLCFASQNAALFIMSRTNDFHTALICMTIIIGGTGFHNNAVTVNPQDLAPSHSGSVFGLMNTVGAIPGFLGVYLAGHILELTQSWPAVFSTAAAINLVGWTIFIVFGSADAIV